MLRFIQEFPRLHTLSGVRRTKYNQYDSIARPIQRWLVAQGVDVRFGARVVDVDFDQTDPADRRVTRLHLRSRDGESTIALAPDDVAMLTLGSITADATYGGNDAAPELIRDRRDGALGAVGRDRAQGQGFRPSQHVLRQHRREQVGIVHPDDARRRAAEPHRRILRQRAGHRRADDVLRVRSS